MSQEHPFWSTHQELVVATCRGCGEVFYRLWKREQRCETCFLKLVKASLMAVQSEA
jgi:hypothetical protein